MMANEQIDGWIGSVTIWMYVIENLHLLYIPHTERSKYSTVQNK